MFREKTHYSLGKTVSRHTAGKIIAAFTLLCFLATTTLPDASHAIAPDPQVNTYRRLYSDIRDDLFNLPDSLGRIQTLFAGEHDKVIIHIQDAHCNYDAQHAIKNLIKHFNEKYGISLICLEGGVGDYDLSPFTDIESDETRVKVADLFLKQGDLNGAEFAGIENPGRFLLWGIENEDLYIENLEVYRKNQQHRQRIEGHLDQLSYFIEALKKHIYSEDLFLSDLKYSQYKDKELSFKDYFSYLIEQAEINAVPIDKLYNIHLLKQVFNLENEIDFTAANSERDKFVEALQQRVSRSQIETLTNKMIRFKFAEITQKDFYEYLIEEGTNAGIDMSGYPSFRKYCEYISKYASVDIFRVMKDLNRLEDILRESMCDNNEQLQLVRLSKNLTMIKRAFDFSLTKDDFDYFKENSSSFRMEKFLSFIRKEAPIYNIRGRIPEEAAELDDRLSEIEKFYYCSFERDKVFIGNIKEKMLSSGFDNTILVTGGFHTENLTKLLRDTGFSYISILPTFQHEKECKSLYFKILGGGYPQMGELIIESVSSSTLQLSSIWNKLGLIVDGSKRRNVAMIQLDIAKKLVEGQNAVLAVKGTNAVITFSMEQLGPITYAVTVAEKTDDITIEADVTITNPANMDFESEKIFTAEQLRVREAAKEAALENTLTRILKTTVPKKKAGVDFLDENDVLVQDYSLIIAGHDEDPVKIISGEEKMPVDFLAVIRARSEQIPFVDEGTLINFLEGWHILTIEDNSYTTGFVDIENKKLYVTETIRLASRVAPEIIPIIIFSEISRREVSPEYLAKTLGLRSDTAGADPLILLGGLSDPKKEALRLALTRMADDDEPLALDTLEKYVQEIQARLDKKTQNEGIQDLSIRLTKEDLRLLKANLNRIGGIGLRYGLLDQLFGGDLIYHQVMDTLRNWEGDEHSSDALATAIHGLRPRAWVSFGDIMAGKAHDTFLGGKIMDALRGKVTEKILDLARKRGIYAYHTGEDEHYFIFPETYDADAVKKFFLDLRKILIELYAPPDKTPAPEGVSDYVLYEANWSEIPRNIQENIEKLREKTGTRIIAQKLVGGNTHILVPKDAPQTFRKTLENNGAGETYIHPFLLPSGIVRWQGDEPVSYPDMKKRAEAILQKWRESELPNKTAPELDELWNSLSESQKKAIRNTAWTNLTPEGKELYASLEDIPPHLSILKGLPGFNKSHIFMEDIRTEQLQEIISAGGVDVLKDEVNFKENLADIKDQTYKGIKHILFGEGGEKESEISAHDIKDIYTGYNKYVLEALLKKIFSMSHEEIKKLTPEQRVFMIRGAPIDFFTIIINLDGTITVLNMDVMFCGDNLPEEIREKVIQELARHVMIRRSDYVIPDPAKPEEEWRIFPFKAANDYLGHDVADNYILATDVPLYQAFLSKFAAKSKTNDPLNREDLKEILIEAVKRTNAAIDEQKFRDATKSTDNPDGKVPIPSLLETLAITETLYAENVEDKVTSLLQRLEAIRSVRDPKIVKEDAEIVLDESGNIVARIRTIDAENIDLEKDRIYDNAYTSQQKFNRDRAKKELDTKTEYALEDYKKTETEMTINKLYTHSRGVITEVTDTGSPLVVFIPYSVFSQDKGQESAANVYRYIRKQYDAENLKVVLYDGKEDLEKKGDETAKVLNSNDKARAVIFCCEGQDIHPKGDVSKDIFNAFTTNQGNPKAYYVEENYKGLPEGVSPKPLIGPHVALAMGIKEFKDGNTDEKLMRRMNRLLVEISGGAVELTDDVSKIISFLNALLEKDETLLIQEIDFETFLKQIEAEEKVNISL